MIIREEDLNPFTVGGTICQSTDWWLKPFRPDPTAFKGGGAELSQTQCFRYRLSVGGLEEFLFEGFVRSSGKQQQVSKRFKPMYNNDKNGHDGSSEFHNVTFTV